MGFTMRGAQRGRARSEMARLHQTSLPCLDGLPAQFRVALWQRPAEVIGGDVIDVWQVSPTRLLVCLADVMGHGATAAIVAGSVRALLYQMRSAGEESPATILTRLNQALATLYEGRFVTAAVCLIDTEKGTLTHCGAGHPPVLVCGGRQMRTLRSASIPMGLDADEVFVDKTVTLEVGDTVTLYSDGISDALDRDVRVGMELVAQTVNAASRSPKAQVRALRSAVRDAVDGHVDDRSVVSVRWRE